jgi:hypothetical protein
LNAQTEGLCLRRRCDSIGGQGSDRGGSAEGSYEGEIVCRTGFKVVESAGMAVPRREIIIWEFPATPLPGFRDVTFNDVIVNLREVPPAVPPKNCGGLGFSRYLIRSIELLDNREQTTSSHFIMK